ncbi:MAG TPA: hydrogenase 4 subunit B, partial [Acetobacteraceae bacterium]|nr:hydrogenase 4 subunit B [Acetobacteraceae bacterium]
MATEFLVLLVSALFILALAASLIPWRAGVARVLLACGATAGVILCCIALPSRPLSFSLPFGPDMGGTHFWLDANASWLLGFGFAAAVLVFVAGPSTVSPRGWCFGAAMSLLGAYGVAGLQDGMSFLVAYEVMSLGGAVMIMAD